MSEHFEPKVKLDFVFKMRSFYILRINKKG